MTQTPDKKIKAILVADIAGFSRLMERDQSGTLARQRALMADQIGPAIAAAGGEIIKGTGDGFLAAFDSIVSAVTCAVEVQRQVAASQTDEATALAYRMAVHIGEVVFDGGDIFGDGVNVASRLEAFAQPGGVVVSGTAQDLLKRNVPVNYRFLGAKPLKNMAKPVRVFEVVAEGLQTLERPKRGRRASVALLAVVLMIAAAWLLLPGWEADTEDLIVTAPDETPSLAVLPLANLSEDAAQDYFVAGLTEDITTDLSQLPDLVVVSAGATGAHQHALDDPRQIADDLSVRYLLTGNVRRQGDTLRINMALLDGQTGQQLWAERYDGAPTDVLTFQDSVVAQVVEALPFQIDFAAVQTAARGGTDDAQAFDAFLRASDRLQRGTPEEHAKAADLLQEAVALDPGYGRAQALLADVYFDAWSRDWTDAFGIAPGQRDVLRRNSLRHVQEAMADPTALAHLVAARHYQREGRNRRMFTEARAALRLDRNDPEAFYVLAWALALVGSKKGALDVIEHGMMLRQEPDADALTLQGAVLFQMGRHQDADIALSRVREAAPESRDARIFHIATLHALGRDTQADVAAARAAGPQGFAADWQFSLRADRRRLTNALTAAGLPESYFPGR